MKKFLLAVGLLLLLGGGGAAAILVWNERQTADVRGSSTREFVTTEQATTTRSEEEVEQEPWPIYGINAARTKVASELTHRPPFSRVWVFRGRSLIEFPPVIAYGRLYVTTNRGRFVAIDAETGEIAWEHRFERCMAASPAVSHGVVYAALMVPKPCGGGQANRNAAGFVIAFDAETGEQQWRFRAGAVESAPLLVDGVVYFGSWDRKIYAVDAETGEEIWSFATGDEVKGSVAYAKDTVYVGSYDGNVYALNATTGKLRWRSGGREGLTGAGNWYATPAVAYGRVYIGNTDGKVYAFGARTGDLLWAHSTGSYVYSSAAVWEKKVFVGSWDEKLYALDAATGDEVWAFEAGGAISGAPTVMDGVVYFATTQGKQQTYGLDARTGARRWVFPDGKYTPLVADAERVYIVGYSRIHALEPTA
jgi:outer membrane protein assembly factor BamB